MVRKKVEGNEEQRRAAARAARRVGEAASARKETTGASKQPRHLSGSGSLSHEEKVGGPHEGKQQWRGDRNEPPGPVPMDEPSFSGRGRPGYTGDHERVFQAIAGAEDEPDGVTLDEAARRAGLPKGQTRALLHDLEQVHGLVTELEGVDDPDLGPRYEVRPGSS